MPLITKETASEMGRRSAEARRLAAERPLVYPELPLDQATDPFTEALACACGETLKVLRESTKAQDRASYARALRELRETYHMVTGQAKPGVLKHNIRPAAAKPAVPISLPSPESAPDLPQ